MMAKSKHKHQTRSQASKQHKPSSSEEEIIEGPVVPDSWEEQTDTQETNEMETEVTPPTPSKMATNRPTEASFTTNQTATPHAEEIHLPAPTDGLQAPAAAGQEAYQVACTTQKEPTPNFPKPQLKSWREKVFHKSKLKIGVISPSISLPS
ncbi:hypothetical protein DSO57_1007379 [Entomophthora muscae]|uniref:Uncharacterized protein n=1 Tax=Entomophthora muscae TaxID=34485 RepID=A0ACC2TV09_9FUNG|nr:hypothetical protein DSO57_1007379 [Entomophthora muscae]